MAIWKDSSTQRQAAPAPSAPEAQDTPRLDLHARAEPAPVVAVTPAARPATDRARAESIIAADIMIEGKIEGSGSVRIAGRFKGDVNVQGDLTIEAGAKLTGSVRADKVTIAGELEGNIEGANQVSLLATGAVVGDVKAGNMTVASGARMRGVAEFGWEEKNGKKAFAAGSETAGNA
jgi:cytoskeletal protein CcmA (bactofilin family)